VIREKDELIQSQFEDKLFNPSSYDLYPGQ